MGKPTSKDEQRDERPIGSKPPEFKVVAAIRTRHDQDARAQEFHGRELQIHEDRAELLSIIGLLFERMTRP